MTDTLQWLEPWDPIDDRDTQAALERQLRIELSQRHILYGETVRLIARRSDTDDALFALTNERVAEVHMTWRRGPEEDPRWPATAIFALLDEWAEMSMRPLHDELSRLR